MEQRARNCLAFGEMRRKEPINPDMMVDLEALTSSLKKFVDNYDSMITLTPGLARWNSSATAVVKG